MGAAAQAQDAARPAPAIPWERIDAGLSQLAAGDGDAAEASFGKARKTDDSGLSELLAELTHAYLAFNLTSEYPPRRSIKANERLDYANRSFYRQHIPPAVLKEALERTRKLLKETPATGSSPSLLRPLLCNLRLLARDHTTDGEPVLETTGKSKEVGSLVLPKPVFAPLPPYTEAARKERVQGSVVMAVVVDSEGCPLSAKVLKPLPQRQADQAEASWKWWAYQPASYEQHPVGLKYVLTFGFAIQ
jgi:TonB family protein